MTQFTKAALNPVTTRQEIHTLVNASLSGLTYTECDRTVLSDKRSNYFISFNLPYKKEQFPKDIQLSLDQPELQQLNVDKIVYANIDSSYYNEIIDGRTVSFTVPQSGTTSLSSKTLYSTTYRTLEKKQESTLLGSNISFLFCDEVNLPYSGTIDSGSRNLSGHTTWVHDNRSLTNNIFATSYIDVKSQDINSDLRNPSEVKYSVDVGSSYPVNSATGYNYDIPVGFVALDKGFLVITNPDIVNSMPWSEGFDLNGGLNVSEKKSDIYFEEQYSSAKFIDIDINFTSSVMCIIMPGEFFRTTNQSYDQLRANQEEAASTYGMPPVCITEIGLHNSKGEVVAYAKLDRPIEKKYGDFVSFTIDLKA